MNVPLLDLRAQLAPLREEICKAVVEIVDSTRYIMGPVVERFEESVADYLGVRYAVGISSGTDALLAALMALDVGPGDIVLTTDYSFFATAGVVARLQATPVFLDIDPHTYNLSAEALAEWFEREGESKGSRVKAIMPVHLFGQCADMDPILAIAEEYGVPVIEDAAQAIGAGYPSASGDRMAGTMGAMGCFSFFPSKNLGGVGDGGMVVTDDAKLAEKLRLLRNHGAKPKYYHALVGGNFRLDPIQAAVLQVKLPYLDQWHQRRGERASYYDRKLGGGLAKPVLAYDRRHHIYNQYVVAVPERRDELAAFLKEANIGHAIYYPVPFHCQECFRHLDSEPGRLVNSRDAASRTIALPVYPELTRPMQDYVIEKVTEFYA